jgi:hypothetical protein
MGIVHQTPVTNRNVSIGRSTPPRTRSPPGRLVTSSAPSRRASRWIPPGTATIRARERESCTKASTAAANRSPSPAPTSSLTDRGRAAAHAHSFAPWTQGLGDQCAISRLVSEGGMHYGGYLDFNFYFEEGFPATLLDRGFALVVTDYQGIGTYGPPTAGIRIPTAHAVIDSARAAMRLPGTSLDPHGPVAFWGYGPGGQGAGAAVEMAPSYAPELNVVGAWLGAPIADYALYADYADGSMLAGTMGFALNAFMAAFPEAEPGVMSTLTPRGVDFIQKTRYSCTDESIMKFMFRHLQPYFNQDYHQILSSEPIKSALAAQRLGSLKPQAPVQIDINRWDPLFPWVGARQLAADWCAQGADVEFWTNEQPPFLNKMATNTMLTYFVEGERGIQWVTDRFNGVPTTPNCQALPPVDAG